MSNLQPETSYAFLEHSFTEFSIPKEDVILNFEERTHANMKFVQLPFMSVVVSILELQTRYSVLDSFKSFFLLARKGFKRTLLLNTKKNLLE